MTDPNLRDFYGRIARVEKARAKGFGFEADGTLGRSYYTRPKPVKRSLLRPVLVLLAVGILMKATIHYHVGATTYDDRVTELQAGTGFAPLGAWLMQADPVTLYVAGKISQVVEAGF